MNWMAHLPQSQEGVGIQHDTVLSDCWIVVILQQPEMDARRFGLQLENEIKEIFQSLAGMGNAPLINLANVAMGKCRKPDFRIKFSRNVFESFEY
jgi:hypothetical protein